MSIVLQLFLSVIFGVISSLVAAYMYFKFSYSLKPELEISNQISKAKTSDGKTKFSIKVVNGSNRNIMNLKIELYKIKLLDVKGEENDRIYRITESQKVTLKKSTLMELEGRNAKGEFAPYEFRFYTLEDLEEFLTDYNDEDPFILTKIFCTDLKTGFGKVFTKKYESINCIKEGPFKAKHSLEIQKV